MKHLQYGFKMLDGMFIRGSIIKPPYSRITAINLQTGEHAWMVPNGDTPAAIANNPALKGLTIPPTGAQTRPVMLATKTLLFTADGYRYQLAVSRLPFHYSSASPSARWLVTTAKPWIRSSCASQMLSFRCHHFLF